MEGCSKGRTKLSVKRVSKFQSGKKIQKQQQLVPLLFAFTFLMKDMIDFNISCQNSFQDHFNYVSSKFYYVIHLINIAFFYNILLYILLHKHSILALINYEYLMYENRIFGSMAQVIECLPIKCHALSSNPHTTKTAKRTFIQNENVKL
jgi:hypothetical protein